MRRPTKEYRRNVARILKGCNHITLTAGFGAFIMRLLMPLETENV